MAISTLCILAGVPFLLYAAGWMAPDYSDDLLGFQLAKEACASSSYHSRPMC